MKLFCALVCSLAATTALAGVNPQLQQVKRVYILAMGSGMDQYLANQLTMSGIFEVVTDPKEADAIFTDDVGEAFQNRLDELYPPPPKPKPVETPKAEDSDDDSKDTKSAKKDPFADIDFSGGAVRTSTFGRGKGNFFVVDRKSRIVLWSVYERSKDSTPHELTKTASRIVKHLKDDLTEKKPAE